MTEAIFFIKRGTAHIDYDLKATFTPATSGTVTITNPNCYPREYKINIDSDGWAKLLIGWNDSCPLYIKGVNESFNYPLMPTFPYVIDFWLTQDGGYSPAHLRQSFQNMDDMLNWMKERGYIDGYVPSDPKYPTTRIMNFFLEYWKIILAVMALLVTSMIIMKVV